MYKLIFSTLLGIAAMFGVAHAVFTYTALGAGDAAQAAPAKEAEPEDSGTGEDTVIRRDDSGQFYLGAQANGQDTRFLIDTGADFVALSTSEAESLDVEFDQANFQPITKTASGVGMGQQVKIERLNVAGKEFRDVDAIVIEGLETNLLGQSLLQRLGHIELRGDEMVIRPAG